MNKEKQLNFHPNDEQRKAFDKVVKAMQSAIDKAVVFFFNKPTHCHFDNTNFFNF